MKIISPKDLEEFERLKKCETLVRWYLEYHDATGCQIEDCHDGGIPVCVGDGDWEQEQCEYCAMIDEATKLIEEIDNER